jgi:hypothetical protein
MLLMNFTATTSQSTRTGDSTKDTMERCRVSTNSKLLKSMERNRFIFGEEVSIFLLQNCPKLTKDTPETIRDIRIFLLSCFLKQK